MITATRAIAAHYVQNHYDDLDTLYREIWGQHLHHGLWIKGSETKEQATRQLVDAMIGFGSFHPRSRICDIGCGYGATAQLLAENLEASVVGVTITPRQYQIARKIRAVRGQVKFHLEDWLDNSVPSSSQDHAIAIESSEHAVDKSQYFRQTARVLKPRGNLTLCAWMENEKASAFEKKYLLTPICDEGQLPSLLSEADYKDVLQKVGFEVTASEDLTDKVKKTWSLVIFGMLNYLFSHPIRLARTLMDLPGDRRFFWTPFRMRIAYETKALRYVMINAKKLSNKESPF